MKQLPHLLIAIILLAVLLMTCSDTPPTPASTNSQSASAAGTVVVQAEVWADNWFAFYLGEQLIYEDTVPVTTERSFNAERFTFAATYPLVLNFVVKDFQENDTGLEYIDTARQQMGDGGFIAQFTNTATGALLAATDGTWTCLVTHKAPLDKACEQQANPVAGQPPCDFRIVDEPANWQALTFDAAAWQPATVYSAAQVGVKEGYNEIAWQPAAHLIWSADLETDNTLLCRLALLSPR